MTMRLFFAVHFSELFKDELLRLRNELRTQAERGRFSLPENLHLTLVFLGDCDARQTNAAKAALDGLTVRPLTVSLNRCGNFGTVYWVGLKDCPQLSALQSELAENLKAQGFRLESRKFKPHITLGREVVLKDAAAIPVAAPLTDMIKCVSLMKSERIMGKLTYTEIHRNLR